MSQDQEKGAKGQGKPSFSFNSSRKPKYREVTGDDLPVYSDRGNTDKGFCKFCKKGNHRLYKCIKFKGSPIDERKKFVSTQSLCFRCFSPDHKARDCDYKALLRFEHCNILHNFLLCNCLEGGSSKPSSSSPEREVHSVGARVVNSTACH